MLAMNPNLQEKAVEEIESLFLSEDTCIKIENLNKLRYLEQTIKETMRLFPVAPLISRSCQEDLVLDGHVIPKDTILLFNFHALHRRSDIWGDTANIFDPEHFSQENWLNTHPFAFLPFSAGKRNCLGRQYAMLSMKVLLSKILKSFQLSTVLKFEDLRFKADVTLKLHPSTPHLVTIKKR